MRQYIESLSGYQKNEFGELTPKLQRRLVGESRRCFEEWGYAI